MAAAIPCMVSTDILNMTVQPAQYFPQHDSKRVKIRYGSFTVAPMDVDNGMADFMQKDIQMPCNDCIITWMQAGLEYSNGTVANADTKLWLHHTVLANGGRTSTVCPAPGYPDTFFASGNERTPIDICVDGTEQAGYYLASTDTLAVLVELMNMSPTSQTGVLTMTYEYIPSPPSSFSHVKVLWLDIGGCDGGSDQPVISTTQAFQYTSPGWTSDVSGKITFIAGHLHDGGTHLTVQKNGSAECDCVATYGADSAYIGGGMSMATSMAMRPRDTSMNMASMSMSESSSNTTTPASSTSSGLMDNVHISNISTCSNPKDGVVNPGDVWTVTANYDPSQHELMIDTDGIAAPIMGIALVYVADLNVTSTTGGGRIVSPSVAITSGTGSSAALDLKVVAAVLFMTLKWMEVIGTAL